MRLAIAKQLLRSCTRIVDPTDSGRISWELSTITAAEGGVEKGQYWVRVLGYEFRGPAAQILFAYGRHRGVPVADLR